jgi:hypothetical protein
LCTFLIIACCIGTIAQYFSHGAIYVVIYVSDNKILFLLYLFKLVQ